MGARIKCQIDPDNEERTTYRITGTRAEVCIYPTMRSPMSRALQISPRRFPTCSSKNGLTSLPPTKPPRLAKRAGDKCLAAP